MIEFCTKKRMGIAILALIFLSVIVLFIENSMSMEHDVKDATQPPENQSQECSRNEDVVIVRPCHQCNILEKKIQQKCKVTGYIESIRCKSSTGVETDVFKSCPKMSWIEERNFWVFETLTAVLGLGAYSIVHIRQQTLNRLLLEKVHKQIASGV